MVAVGLYKKKCKQCGKFFECRSEYAYKLQKLHKTEEFHWFCSYKHLRQYEKEHDRPEKLTPREAEAVKFMQQGLKTLEIAEKMGVSRNRILAIKQKWEDINWRADHG